MIDEFVATSAATRLPHAERVRASVPDVCRWPTMAIRDMTMVDADAALAADPLFHVGADRHFGRVDVRYWYLRPLEFSCRHCAEGGSVLVVSPETVVCRHRMTHRTRHSVLEG